MILQKIFYNDFMSMIFLNYTSAININISKRH